MIQQPFPVIFSGHGSPMLALQHNDITRNLSRIGGQICSRHGTPRAILAISAHWYVSGTFIQSAPQPRQVYDMYGFPEELYQVTYPVPGDATLTRSVQNLLGAAVSVNDQWGIDHGTWTILVHMFPDADIPVVQLSVNRDLSPQELYDIGQKLAPLRTQGYLIFASGNVVHNLGRVEWNNPGGTPQTLRFNDYIIQAVRNHNDDAVIHYTSHPDAAYAVPTPDHFLPLVMTLGAAQGETVAVFNNTCNLGSMAMTGFIFGF